MTRCNNDRNPRPVLDVLVSWASVDINLGFQISHLPYCNLRSFRQNPIENLEFQNVQINFDSRSEIYRKTDRGKFFPFFKIPSGTLSKSIMSINKANTYKSRAGHK